MPKITNAKYELIAQGVAKGLTPEEAYVAAGGSADRSNAWRAVRRPEVTKRVAELQAKAAERTLVTVEKMAERLLAIVEKAEKADDAPLLNVARAGIMDVAKLYGLITDKTATKLSGDPDAPIVTETKLDVSALSEEQLRALSSIKVT